MNIAEVVLVIFLSAALLVFLTLAIVATSITIGILRDIKKIADQAEEASANLGQIIRIMGRKALPLAISTIVAAIMKQLKSLSKKKKNKEDD
jgi:ABC-type long-subunit fatty acid transport system fused permease/ATPase subunit